MKILGYALLILGLVVAPALAWFPTAPPSSGSTFSESGDYSPTGTWDWSGVNGATTWPTFNQSTTGNAATSSAVKDADGDTYIQPEASADEDIIRFYSQLEQVVYWASDAVSGTGYAVQTFASDNATNGVNINLNSNDKEFVVSASTSTGTGAYWRMFGSTHATNADQFIIGNSSGAQFVFNADGTITPTNSNPLPGIYQTYDADLDTYAGITPSSIGQSLLVAATEATAATAIGLGTADDVTFNSVTAATFYPVPIDDARWTLQPATAGETQVWGGMNHDSGGTNNDCFETRFNTTPGTSVVTKVCPDGSFQINGLTVEIPQSKSYTANDDDDETIGTDLTASIILVTGDNDADNDSIDLQDGTVAGQEITFIGVAGIDSDDTFTIDVETDSTCTGCSGSGSYTMDAIGDKVTYYWNGTAWFEMGSYSAN